ncbi:polyhydroxybutyrate depolymerase [Filimonas lacunae]|uniref:Polyhydroxybutyrate depolymerase n=1 Tax=Filimonas lacunae TaxID=477680 RepID=A0A173MC08_9BACT|nr:esterase [Filimonas lacunae]BAV05019.1 hydrolase [Filimonas lacunae]SIT33645.1 polyhydroxybutyrate depolymerase [Filimonas lacunae]
MNSISKITLVLFLLFPGVVNAQETGVTAVKQWEVNGVAREALVYIPVSAKSRPTPVIFLFHGHGGNMQEILRNHDFEKLWPESIVIAPQGLKTPGQLVDRAGNYSGWQQAPGDSNDRDIHFFDEMYRSLTEEYKVDKKQVYVTGHSNGGSFTYLLWAMRGDSLAAVAPSAGVAFKFNKMLKPKPVMHIMGENDLLVKPAWQKMMFSSLLKLNECNMQGQPFAESATMYPSAIHMLTVLYLHAGGHVYPRETDAVVVKFFKSASSH